MSDERQSCSSCCLYIVAVCVIAMVAAWLLKVLTALLIIALIITVPLAAWKWYNDTVRSER